LQLAILLNSGWRLKKRLQLFLAQFYRQLAAEVPVAVRLLVGVNDLNVKLNRLLPPLDEKFHRQLGADLETAFENQPNASLREIQHPGYPANLLGVGFGHIDRAIGGVARPDSAFSGIGHGAPPFLGHEVSATSP